jgi:uncharacterized membrane protein (DUF4010 family)
LTQRNNMLERAKRWFSIEARASILRTMTNDGLFTTLVPIATALGCGLLIGIERERRKKESDIGAFAGMRTFALVALLGALLHRIGTPWLEACGGLLIVLLIAIAYAHSESQDVGITTEVSLFVTYIIGITAAVDAASAAAIAVVVVALLLTRTRLHRFATETLTRIEVRDGVILLAVALIVLPLLPDQEVRALGAINLYRVGVVVVTLLSIQTVAHVALRTVGERIGIALSGFLSGFVSSTATFAAMAARARDSSSNATSFVSGALLSQLASMVQLIVLVALLSPALLGRVSLSLILGGTVILAASIWMLRRAAHLDSGSVVQAKRMFNPLATLAFVALLSLFTLVVGWANEAFGSEAANLTATLAALVDLHAASAAVLSMGADERLSADETLTALLLMLSVNATAKTVISFGGGKAFFWRVVVVLSVALSACWAPLLLHWL